MNPAKACVPEEPFRLSPEPRQPQLRLNQASRRSTKPGSSSTARSVNAGEEVDRSSGVELDTSRLRGWF